MGKRYYKGFDKDLKCNGFQYGIGKTYEEPDAKLCSKGFHACEAPLNVFEYYKPGDGSRYCEVELDDVSTEKSNDTKVVAKRITVCGEIGIPGLVKAHVEWVKEQIDNNNTVTNTGFRSAATNTGDWSAATNTGDWSAATNTGDCSAATVEGNNSVAIVTGSNSKVKGSIGCAIVAVERNDNGQILSVASRVVDGKKIKANTWYKCMNGRLVVCKENDYE